MRNHGATAQNEQKATWSDLIKCDMDATAVSIFSITAARDAVGSERLSAE